jgi:CheY-like chemotaxis protein
VRGGRHPLASNLLGIGKRPGKEGTCPPTRPALIAEDDPTIREVMAEALGVESYLILTAEHGAALPCLAQTRPCLSVLDLMLPVLDGFAFRAAQRAAPQWAVIPVIVLSAFPASVETATTLDAVAYLSKPVELDRLVEVVERYCGAPT